MRHLASVALWALTAFGIILVAASALGSGAGEITREMSQYVYKSGGAVSLA